MSQYSNSTFQDDKNTSWNKSLSFIKENTKVLDVGCSSGNFGEALVESKNCTVDGIEINKTDAEMARSKLRNVYTLDVERDDLGEITEKYDVIFCGDVIEHFAHPIKTLKRIRTLLKEEGELVFSVPNITHMSVRLMLFKGEITYGKTGLLDETHLHFYNQEEIYRVLNSAGYEITQIEYIPKNIPTDVIKEELRPLGVEIRDEFKKLNNSVNASVYQFVGVAKKGEIKKQEIPDKSPDDLTQKHMKKWKNEHRTKYKELEEKYHALKKAYESLKDGRRND